MKCIREWLTASGKSQDQFATDLGVSRPFVTQFLNGKYSNIKVELLDRLVRVTEIPMAVIMKELMTRIRSSEAQK